MSGRRTWLLAVMLVLLIQAGCCRWCDRHCGNPAPVAAVPAYTAPVAQPCVPCCPPPCCSPGAPVAGPPAQSWQRNPACCP